MSGKQRVVVAPQPVIFGMCRIFQSLREVSGDHLIAVVKTFAEAQEILGGTRLQFTPVQDS